MTSINPNRTTPNPNPIKKESKSNIAINSIPTGPDKIETHPITLNKHKKTNNWLQIPQILLQQIKNRINNPIFIIRYEMFSMASA